MASLADSDAYCDSKRMLPQHQAALTVLEGILVAPGVTTIEWLDLACGKGQILANLEKNFSSTLRQKIRFTAYDVDNEHARVTSQTANCLGLDNVETLIGELGRFWSLLPVCKKYDFITLITVVHEIPPLQLPAILFECIDRLTPIGRIFLYDMDRISPPELGAVVWSEVDPISWARNNVE